MLLAIDTATSKIGIALYDGVEVLHESVWLSPYRHTVELAPAIEEALRRTDRSMDDVEAIGLAIGPGSYTGLRIGSAVAKGLALALNLALVAVPTFDILAAAFPADPDMQLAAVLKAGRGRLAVGWYQAEEGSWTPSQDAGLYTPDEFSRAIRTPTIVCGELDDELRKMLGRKYKNVALASPAASLRRPAVLAEIAWERWKSGETNDPETTAPIYLQTSEKIPG